MKLTSEQRKTLLDAICYRTSMFPRADLQTKLESADSAYHLAKMPSTSKGTAESNNSSTSSLQPDQEFSRFQELQNALVREIGETYAANYTSTFLSKSQLFAMTSPADRQSDAVKFNVLLSDQSKRTNWGANLSKVLLDVSKYNLAAVETDWDSVVYYALSRAVDSKDTKTRNGLKRTKVTWHGNHIRRLDMYNTMFDISVPPEQVSKYGEWAGTIDIYSQVRLKQLIDQLQADAGTTVYTEDPEGLDDSFNIFKLDTRVGNTDTAYNLDYRTPKLSTYGAGIGTNETNQFSWEDHIRGGGTVGVNGKSDEAQKYYEVFRGYLRVVPSAYSFPESKDEEVDSVQLWKVYILERKHILATKLMDNAHDLLPIDIAVTDADSLTYNASGPAQICIPYAKLAKQLTDRVLAGADRAISDRAIFDETMLSTADVNTKVPDPKIPLSSALPPGRKITDFYHQIPFDNNATARLYDDRDRAESAGRKAAGINLAQQGQFVKGNKTLYEYDDVMQNADSKQFQRAVFLENTLFSSIKTKLKLNIIQYQQTATLLDPNTQEEIKINPADLYTASVQFKLIDGLMPSEFVMSPNVQQQLFTMLTTMPEVFQKKYDVPGLVSHILQQSNGINMEQYKLKEPSGGGQ